MNISTRERRALSILGASIVAGLILQYGVFRDPAPSAAGTSVRNDSDNIALAEQRAARLRQLVALVPARVAIAKQVSSDLTDREKGLIAADTAAQAQAALLEIARRVGKGQQIEVRGGEFAAPKAFGDYGLVYAWVNFDCHVEQLVNFLSDLTRQPELVVPSEERVTSGNPKDKLMGVRILLAGVVAKKLVPEKKGLSAF